jgi:hypothetical protein
VTGRRWVALAWLFVAFATVNMASAVIHADGGDIMGTLLSTLAGVGCTCGVVLILRDRARS